MTLTAVECAGKGYFTAIHCRRTNLTSRHVTTTGNMSAQSTMDQKELEDRLAAAEALSSLGSIASVAAAFKDSGIVADLASVPTTATEYDSTFKTGTRGGRKNGKGMGRETKSRSARGRGRGKGGEADNLWATSATVPPTSSARFDSLPGETLPFIPAAATSKATSSRGRGRGRGRGGKQGSKAVLVQGHSSRRETSQGSLHNGGEDSLHHVTPSSGNGVHGLLTPASRTAVHSDGTPSVSSRLGASIVSSTSSRPSPLSSLSLHIPKQPTPSSSQVPSAPTTPSSATTPNLASLSLGSLGGLLGVPSIPNLPSLPSAVPALQLNTSNVTLTPSDGSAISPISPQSRGSGEKSLPLKKRKVIEALAAESSTSSAHKTGCESSPSADVKVAGTSEASNSPGIVDKGDDDNVVSPAPPVAPVELLRQVMPPALFTQLLSEIETAITPDEDGDIPLHIAVVQENLVMVKKLIQLMSLAGQRVDRYNKQHQTPLHLAVKLSSLPSIQMLLEASSDPNLVDSGGLTSTHMAVQVRDIDCLEALLQWSKFPCDLNYRNFDGLAPLHTAVMNNDLEIVTRLLEQSVDVNIMDGKSGRTVLFHAAESNQKEAVELLLSHGADPEIANYAGVVPALAAQGRSHCMVARLLARAVEEGGEEELKEKEVKVLDNRNVESMNSDGNSRLPHASLQDAGHGLSVTTTTEIKQRLLKVGAHSQASRSLPTTPPILQSSTVPGSLARAQLVKNVVSPASSKPPTPISSPLSSPRHPPPKGAMHAMPGVVSKNVSSFPGNVAKSATLVRRSSVPVQSEAVRSVVLGKCNTPPLSVGVTGRPHSPGVGPSTVSLPVGLVQALGKPRPGVGVSAGGAHSSSIGPSTASLPVGLVQAPGKSKPGVGVSSRIVPSVKTEVEESEGTPGVRLASGAAAPSVSQEHLRNLLLQNLLKAAAEKQNGGQPRVVNWPALPGLLPLSLSSSAPTGSAHSPIVCASPAPQIPPLRGVSRVAPLPVPTSTIVTSPCVTEIGVTSLSSTTMPSAAHSQPTRPLLVFRSCVDPVSGDVRHMGSVELRHVTTDAIIALQQSSTNSVNPANQSGKPTPTPLDPQQARSFFPAGLTMGVTGDGETAPPFSNHVNRSNNAPSLVFVSDSVSDEPTDLSLKPKKTPQMSRPDSVKKEPGLSLVNAPELSLSPVGGDSKKRKLETSHQDLSKHHKVARVKSPNASPKPKTIDFEGRVSVGVSESSRRIAPSNVSKAGLKPTPSEGMTISISESGLITSETCLDDSSQVVEISKGRVIPQTESESVCVTNVTDNG